ncbi:MAG: MBL fold metallo-hydrolase [Candidatus Riflebacteria bacterium]|nr:MBL fold metallo-hydrolase [Candidatus Riflebacteria bacterium]
MKLYSLEGNVQKLDGGAMYGNAPREMWRQWSPPDEMNRIPLACRSLLLRTDDGRNILFEAGIGAFFDDKMKERYGVSPAGHVLLHSLQQTGLTDADIDMVVLSHLHFDHAGGLLSEFSAGAEPRLLFPKAEFIVGAMHWERARSGHQRDKASFVPVLNALLEKSGRLVLVREDGSCKSRNMSWLSPLVTFSFSNGHTPGLMISRINIPSGPLVFVADLIPGSPWTHIPITMGYDRFPELLISEKTALLKDLLRSGGKLFFTHDPVMPCGLVKIDEKGRYFVSPVDLESLNC